MGILIYNIITIAAVPFLLPIFLYRILSDQGYRRGVGNRLGLLPHEIKNKTDGGRRYWFHAVSVGEVMAAIPLIRIIRERHHDAMIILSTVTKTGNQIAQEQLSEVNHIIYLPFDLIWITGRVVDIIRPGIFIFFETEIWPNLLFCLKKRGIPSVMVNGRISDKSFRRYGFVKPALKNILNYVNLFLMQTEEDKEKIISIGADPKRVFNTGNMKYDRALELMKGRRWRLIRDDLHIPAGSVVITAGSTHQAEEEMLVDIFRQILADYPDTVMIIAPRHLDRLNKIESMIIGSGVPFLRRSNKASSPPRTTKGTIILLDTIGELSDLYRISTIAFVGGSLVPVGGHNILEPAAYGRPVIFGPYMDNFREIARLMIERGGAIQAEGQDDLYKKISRLLSDKDVLERMGRESCLFVKEHAGAAEMNMKFIEGFIN